MCHNDQRVFIIFIFLFFFSGAHHQNPNPIVIAMAINNHTLIWPSTTTNHDIDSYNDIAAVSSSYRRGVDLALQM